MGSGNRLFLGSAKGLKFKQSKSGVIERICGEFGNPEELAYGRDGTPKQPLYRVRFRQIEVWDDYAESPSDTIDVEIFEHWLEPGA